MTLPLNPIKVEEYKEKLSKALKGRKLSTEHKDKLSKAAMKRSQNHYRLAWETRRKDKKTELSWYQRNRDYAIKKRRAYYKTALEEKAGRPKPMNCEACGGTKRICFDHNHKTGKFRGWICESCNVLLGFARDNKKILKSLIKYLEKYS